MNYVSDTNICLYMLKGSLVADVGMKPGLSIPERQGIRALLSGVTLIGLPPDVRDKAARIRIATRLKLPDSIIAVTALTLGAELLSNDRQMRVFPA